jgi:hypothetical protein
MAAAGNITQSSNIKMGTTNFGWKDKIFFLKT